MNFAMLWQKRLSMKKTLQYIIPVLLMITGMLFVGRGFEEEREKPVAFAIERPEPKPAIYPQWKEEETARNETVQIPRVGKDFVGFKEALAFNESGGNYHVVNSLGFMGKYQFGPGTLRYLGIDRRQFLKNPALQEEAFKKYMQENRRLLAKEIEKYSGKYVHGIRITESGILAAAHLAGASAVKKYLRSHGKISAKDAYGTRIEDYLRRFAGYDLSQLEKDSVE